MEEADDLQEAVYEVGQEFAEMFVIQRDSLEWLPYPQNKTVCTIRVLCLSLDRVKSQQIIPNHPHYLKKIQVKR